MGGRPVGYFQAWRKSQAKVYIETNPAKWSEQDLNLQLLDYKSGALTPPPPI